MIDLFSIVSSFVVLIFSLIILCMIGAKLIIVFVEQGKLWGRKSITQLVPTFVGLAVILPSIFDLLFYASDAAPSILLGQSVFGGDFHTAGGYGFIFGFYAQNFQLLVLAALKFKLMLQRMLKKAHILIKCSFFACWLVSLCMAAAVQRKICKFEFHLHKFAYLCLEPVTSPNGTSNANGDGKLGTLNGTLVSALLLVTLFCIYGQIQRRKMPISGIGAQNDLVETNPNRVRLAEVVKTWNKTLLLQFIINVCRLIAFSALLFFENRYSEKFVGLGVTLIHIICCCASSFVYLDAFGLIIKYMYQLELRNLYSNSLMHFRLMASRRNLSQSFRRSCASFNQFTKTQQDAATARAAAAGQRSSPQASIPSVSASVSPILSPRGSHGGTGTKATTWLPMTTPGGCSSRTSSAASSSDCCSQTTRLTSVSRNVGPAAVMGVTTPDIDEFQNDMLIPIRPGIPVLQVEYYPNTEDNWSLCNYESDSCKSLRERAEHCIMLCSAAAEPQSPTCSMQSFTGSHDALLLQNGGGEFLPLPNPTTSLNDGLVFLNAENLLSDRARQQQQQLIGFPIGINAYSKSNAFTTNVLLDNPSFFDYPCVI